MLVKIKEQTRALSLLIFYGCKYKAVYVINKIF